MSTVWSPIRGGVALGGVLALLPACSSEPNFGGAGGSPASTATSPASSGQGGEGSPTSASAQGGGGTGGGGAGGEGTGGGACATAADCPAPGAPCLAATCTQGVCDATPRPAGTPIADATGNCQTSKCDASGALENVLDPDDVVRDGNPCTSHTCDGIGQPATSNVPAGLPGNDEGGGCVGVCQDGASAGTCGWRLYTRPFSSAAGSDQWSNTVLSASWSGANAPPLDGIQEAESTFTEPRLFVWHEDGSFYERQGAIWLPPRDTAALFELPAPAGIALAVAWRPEEASTNESMLLTTDESPPRARSYVVQVDGAFVPQTGWDPIAEPMGDPEAPPQHLVPYDWGFTVQTAYIETPGWVVFWEGLGGDLYEFSGSTGGFDSKQPEATGLRLDAQGPQQGPQAGTIAAAWYDDGVLHMIAP